MENFLLWARSASLEELQDVPLLAHKIGSVGLFYESRTSPNDPSKSIYGDDVVYMLNKSPGSSEGLWQTPIQLAKFLVFIGSRGVETYFDIGTFSGYTITLITIYLLRFGLKTVHTFDISNLCSSRMRDIWTRYHLPITYFLGDTSNLLATYDLVFIDGDHETGVFTDFANWRDKCKFAVFHDIIDQFCPCVRKFWSDAKNDVQNARFYEFTDHPNGFSLMGIGVIEFHLHLLT